MHLNTEDIVGIKDLVTLICNASFNLVHNNIHKETQLEMLDTITERSNKIDEILLKYHHAMFYER